MHELTRSVCGAMTGHEERSDLLQRAGGIRSSNKVTNRQTNVWGTVDLWIRQHERALGGILLSFDVPVPIDRRNVPERQPAIVHIPRACGNERDERIQSDKNCFSPDEDSRLKYYYSLMIIGLRKLKRINGDIRDSKKKGGKEENPFPLNTLEELSVRFTVGGSCHSLWVSNVRGCFEANVRGRVEA
jgi:hypothetical protein